MKHALDELFELIYRYYPRGVERYDPAIPSTDEYKRRVELRRREVLDYGRFRALLGRLRAQFSGHIVDDEGLYLPRGTFDAAYAGRIVLPTLKPHEGQHSLHFRSSFLAPYYLLWVSRVLYVPRGTDQGGFDREVERRFECTPDEQPYARAVAAAIEETYGGEPLPPDVGRAIVPDLALLDKRKGEATVFLALFTAPNIDEWA